MATHTLTDYEGLHERMCRLREMEIGLDGVICAKGGEVRVHLPYMAACNHTLFKRITTLMKNNQNKLILKECPLVGIENIINFFYSGKLEVTSETLPDILEGAMATESLDTVEFCLNFANNSNTNLWSHFLKVAFKYPVICQPEDFVPNLILKNISIIPREVLMKDLNPTYLSYILEKGKVEEKDMALCLSVFLDMILNDKSDASQQKHTLGLMKDICTPNITLNISNNCEDSKVLALLEASLSINFSGSVKACCEMVKQRKPYTEIITKVVQWIPNHHGTLQAEYLIEYACNAFKELPQEFSCDVLCELVAADWLEFQEFEIFQKCLEWLQDKTEDEKHRILGKLRFRLMSKGELEQIIAKYGSYVYCVATNIMGALQYHMCPHNQPFYIGQDAKQRQAMPGVLGLIQSENIASNQIELIKSSVCGGEPGPFTKTNCELPGDCTNLSLNAIANVNGFIFVSGELGKGKPKTNSFNRFNTCLNTWLTLSPISARYGKHTLTKVGGSLLAVGGKSDDGDSFLASVEEYDIASDSWKQGQNLPFPINQHAAASLSDQVYLSGGMGNMSRKSVLCYSKEAWETGWETRSPMLYGRQCHSMVTYGDMLIVCGGAVQNQEGKWGNVSVVECYDTKLDQWTEMLSKPLIPFDSGLATCSGGHVYILGGLTGENAKQLDDIQRYNITLDRWEICQTKLPRKGKVYLGFVLD